jgi:hypothetical protein
MEDTYFRCEIIGRATKRPGVCITVLRKAEVRDFDMSVKVQQDILWLEVAVDNVKRVQIVQC